MLNRIWRNLRGSKNSTSSTKIVFFWPIGKQRWPPWPLIGIDIFDFWSENTEWNWTKLDRKQVLNASCIFPGIYFNKRGLCPLHLFPGIYFNTGGLWYFSVRYEARWNSRNAPSSIDLGAYCFPHLSSSLLSNLTLKFDRYRYRLHSPVMIPFPMRPTPLTLWCEPWPLRWKTVFGALLLTGTKLFINIPVFVCFFL